MTNYFPLSSATLSGSAPWIPTVLPDYDSSSSSSSSPTFTSPTSLPSTSTETPKKLVVVEIEAPLIFSSSPSPLPKLTPSPFTTTQIQTRRRRTTLSPRLTGTNRHRHVSKHLKASEGDEAPHSTLLFGGISKGEKEKEKEKMVLVKGEGEGINDLFSGMNYSFAIDSKLESTSKGKGKEVEVIGAQSGVKSEEAEKDVVMNGLIKDLDSLVVNSDEKARIARKDRRRVGNVRIVHPGAGNGRRGLRDSRALLGGKISGIGIKDLPEELMIKIFNYLPDRYGFKPTRIVGGVQGGSEWYTPPLAFGLVCKYFLNIARQVFYKTIILNTPKRIQRLHKVLKNPILGSFVQRIIIRLPLTSSELLDLPILVLSNVSSSTLDLYQPPEKRDKGLIFKPRWTFLTSSILPLPVEEAKLEYSTPREMLRDVLRGCPNLLSLEVSGIDLSTLLSAHPSSTTITTISTPSSYASILLRKVSPSSTSSLVNVSNEKLLQLRLDSITTLTLSSTFDGIHLTSKELSSSILLLSNLTDLKIVGYKSFDLIPLVFTPPILNVVGNRTRSLPNRARKFSLKKLEILDSTFNLVDMKSLFSFIQVGSLRTLIIEQVYHPKIETEIRGNRILKIETCSPPTLCTLPSVQHLLGSLITLRLSLYNYSPATTGTTAEYLKYLDTSNLVDQLLPNLSSLEELDIGGSIATSNFLNLLPSTVKELRLLNCTPINPYNLKSFLQNISSTRSTFPSSFSSSSLSSVTSISNQTLGSHAIEIRKPSQLKNVVILGNYSDNWRSADDKKGRITNWDLQQACWDAGITWRNW